MKKTGIEFKNTVYGYWSKLYNCNIENFKKEGIFVIRENNLSENLIIQYNIDKMKLIRVSPKLANKLNLPIGYNSTYIEDIFEILKEQKLKITSQNTLLDHFLDAKNFKPFKAENNYTLRQLDPIADDKYLQELYACCSDEDLDEADIYIDKPDPIIFGYFDNDKMIAYASHRYWDDIIADMGVLIHPKYRGQGLGKSVISRLCEWNIKHKIVPMYRVFSYHTTSIKIPIALGFKEIVPVSSIRILQD
ncbi:GNAT family N-acetyltransferase [Clostridiaceae bacterium M8S5]|nr:GNAT family N-acetyltransferase [Clostridiaceae bacterium M8S5]